MSASNVKLIGLVRDFLMALGGALVLFGTISAPQWAGIVAIVAPAVALGSYVYSNVNSPKGQL